MTRARSIVLLGTFALAACAEPTVPTPTLSRAGGVAFVEGEQHYVLIGGNSLPQGLAASVAAAGGQLVTSIDAVGFAVASSSNPAFVSAASKIKGLQAVVADEMMEFKQPQVGDEIDALSHGVVGAHGVFRPLQWNVEAISAPAAWAAGNIGTGARVAVIDGGIHAAHQDLSARIDVPRSASFVPGFLFNQDVGTFWHGTHVAGIIAASDNTLGTVGIAPGSTIIGVKVLHNGTGNFSWLIPAIVYAATPIAEGGAGAHIINMSLGGLAVKNGSANAHFVNLISKATSYARSRGVTVIAAAGNDAIDLDHPHKMGFDLPANLLAIPAEANGVINVSATGPLGFALGATNFDRPASYTNFGQSSITLAGPGGDFALPGNALCTVPLLPPFQTTNFCWVFDMVISTSRGNAASTTSYSFAAGTSMASPAVAGVAALVVGKYGPMHPSQLEAILRNSADDLGKPGNDDFYGRGRVNAARAVNQ